MSDAEATVKDRVEQAIAEAIRPALQRDGGDVELVEVTDENIVQVRLQGACRGCPMAQMTIKGHVEAILRDMVPEVESVEAVP